MQASDFPEEWIKKKPTKELAIAGALELAHTWTHKDMSIKEFKEVIDLLTEYYNGRKDEELR